MSQPTPSGAGALQQQRAEETAARIAAQKQVAANNRVKLRDAMTGGPRSGQGVEAELVM